MNIKEINKIINGQIYNFKDVDINKIKIDSRLIEENDLFISLTDEYIEDAINNGASVIISNNEINVDIPYIRVEDVYQVLILLGKNIRKKYNIPFIAITGSNGKTTTKELVADILSRKYTVLKNEKNYNNHIGVPLTLFNLDSTYDICVLELGMNHLKEIEILSNIIVPDVSVITNIGSAHIGNLGSYKNIYKAKLEIIKSMKKGTLIVNKDSKYLNKIKTSLNTIKIGLKDIYDIKLEQNRSLFKKTINNCEYQFVFNVPGKHLLTNVLIAIEIGLLYDVEIFDIQEAIENFKMIDNRLNLISKENFILLNDCYNSSYESLLGSLEVLKLYDSNKILILGDILELGHYSKKIHLKIKRQLKKIKNITILCVGEFTKYVKLKNSIHFNNIIELINFLDKFDYDNNIILIKGSRMMKLEYVKDYFITK